MFIQTLLLRIGKNSQIFILTYSVVCMSRRSVIIQEKRSMQVPA